MMARQRKELTITVEAFVKRSAWLEWQGRRVEANALRDRAAWFNPIYRVDEQAVQAQIEELQRHTAKPPQ